jgi:arylsulfatase A
MNVYGQNKHVIIITADDLGVNDLGCYGNTFIETPNIDALVNNKSFVKMNRAYAATPICSPTRASIITGRAPARIGMTEHLRATPPLTPTQMLFPPINISGLPIGIPTVAQFLLNQTYKTAIIGKWHLGGTNASPLAFGYQSSYASGGAGLPVSFFYPFFNNGTFPELLADSKAGDFLDDVLANKAVKFIEENKDKPFFLHVNFYAPHVPIQAKQSLVDKYNAKRKLSPSDIFPKVHYAAMVDNLDQNIGTVIDALKKIGKLEDMLIIITSDNGGLDVEEVPQYAQHTPPTDNGNLRSGKGNLYEGGIRIPFLINQPMLHPSLVINTNDIYNTIAQYVGDKSTAPDGVSLYKKEVDKPETQYWHFPHYSPQQGYPTSAILDYPYKFILHWGRRYADLFNIETDPSESNNLSRIDTARVNQMSKKLLTWINTVGGIRPIDNPIYSPVPTKVEETFTYKKNTRISGQDEGIGWYNSWQSWGNPSNAFIDSSLTSPLNTGTLKLPLDQIQNIGREIDIPFPLNSNQIYWLSFDVRRSDLKSDFSLNLLDQEYNSTMKVEYKNENTFLSIGNDNKLTPNSSLQNNVLIKIDLSKSEKDSISLWINHNKEKYPNTSDARIKYTGDIKGKFIQHLLIQTSTLGTSTQAVWLDNIVLSPNYIDIVPIYENTRFSAYEPFLYVPNSNVEDNGRSDDVFRESWFKSGGTTANKATITAGSLIKDQIKTTGNKSTFDFNVANNQIRMDRRLQSPLKNDGRTYWFSYLMDTKATTALSNISNFNLTNSKITAVDGNRIGVGRIFGTGKLGMVTPPNGAKFTTNLNDVGTQYIIFSVSTTGNSSLDTIRVWFNPNPYQKPINDKADITLNTALLKDGIDIIRLRVEGADNNQVPLSVSFDEIRYATQWESLQNNTSIIELKNTFGFELFPNPAREEIYIKFDNTKIGKVNIKLTDLQGRLLQDFGNYQPNELSLESLRLPNDITSNMYLVIVQNLDGLQIAKPIMINKN